MKRDRNGYGCPINPFLHNPMTAALTDGKKSVVFENLADFRARRTRSLPNRNLDLRDKDFVVEPLDDFRRVRRFEEKGESLNQVCSRLFNCRAFTRDIELWT